MATSSGNDPAVSPVVVPRFVGTCNVCEFPRYLRIPGALADDALLEAHRGALSSAVRRWCLVARGDDELSDTSAPPPEPRIFSWFNEEG